MYYIYKENDVLQNLKQHVHALVVLKMEKMPLLILSTNLRYDRRKYLYSLATFRLSYFCNTEIKINKKRERERRRGGFSPIY